MAAVAELEAIVMSLPFPLHFETSEAAAQCARSLRVWAKFMEENAEKQIKGMMSDGRGGVCAMGAWCQVMRYRDDDFGNSDWELLPGSGLTYGAIHAVSAAVARQAGFSKSDYVYAIETLNDEYGVTFPQFATACRTVACVIEEHHVTPSPVAERELAEA